MIPGLAQWVKNLVLPWLWRRPAAAALFQALAWELSCATVVALKKKKKLLRFCLMEIGTNNNLILVGLIVKDENIRES